MNDLVQNEFLNKFIEQSNKTVEFMTRINANLEQLNDNNVLHRESLESGNKVLGEAVASFKASVVQQNTNFSFWKKIILLLTIAIIILAGVKVDEISKFLGLF